MRIFFSLRSTAALIAGFCINPITLAEERPVYGISQSLHTKLQKIEEILTPQNIPDFEPDFALAMQATQTILNDCRRCNPYEYATLYRYLGWLSFQNNELELTISSYENIVALSTEIPLAFEQEALLSLAKIYLQEERFTEALKNLHVWKNLAQDIPAEIYELEARIEYVLENHPAALDNISLAVAITERKGLTPKESWLLFQRNLYYNIEDFSACLSVQRKLVELYSKDAHWRDLAVFYGLVGDESKQIAAFDMAWLMEGLFKENDILNFAWLLQNAEYPYKAALVIENAMNKGIVARSSKNLQLQARAWYLASESGRAIAVMEIATQMEADASALGFLTDLYLESDLYEAAVASANQALKTGAEKGRGRLHLNKGIALLALQRFNAAETAFRLAAEDESVSDTAQKWLAYSQKESLLHQQLSLLD